MEKTFIMLKPDCVRRGLIGEVIRIIENKGYRITDAKMMMLEPRFLYVHYEHISDKPFFADVINDMLSGPVLGLCVRGENAVAGMRMLIGATKVEEALPGTIRGDYAFSTATNLVHGSDSKEAAEAELTRFFGTAQTEIILS